MSKVRIEMRLDSVKDKELIDFLDSQSEYKSQVLKKALLQYKGSFEENTADSDIQMTKLMSQFENNQSMLVNIMTLLQIMQANSTNMMPMYNTQQPKQNTESIQPSDNYSQQFNAKEISETPQIIRKEEKENTEKEKISLENILRKNTKETESEDITDDVIEFLEGSGNLF